jgi:hypothetical protein
MQPKPTRSYAPRWLLSVLLATVSLPALAQTPPPADTPQAGIGAKLLWGGAGLECYWAQSLLDDRLILGAKGAGLLIGGGPGLQAGALAGWRLPLDGQSALQAELSAGVIYANSAIGGGGPVLRDWAGLVEPAIRYMWQVSTESWLGIYAACGLTLPIGAAPLMPLPALGVSITTMRPR